MQVVTLATMATHTVLAASPSPSSLPLPSRLVQSPNLSHFPPLHSSFHGLSLKLPRQPSSYSLSLAAKKPLAVVAATEKAVAVLKGNSDAEGVVTLTQEDDGVAEATIVDKQIPLSVPNAVIGRAFVVHELEDDLGGGHEFSLTTGNDDGRLACVAAVPKKRTSKSKTRIRKNVWKRKGYFAALKALSLAKSLATGKSKSFWCDSLKEE